MKIKSMRLIDELAGVPMCAALSLFAHSDNVDWQGFQKLTAPKILIIHMSEMGALVLAQPALEELRRRLPQAELYFLVFPPIDTLIAELKLTPADHVFTLNKRNFARLASDTLRTLRRLRKIGIDAVINEENFSRFAAIFSYLACPRGLRLGFYPFGLRGLYKGKLETHRLQYNDHIHASRSYLNLVRSLWTDPTDLPLLKSPLSDSAQADVTPRPGACPTIWGNYLPVPFRFNYEPSPENSATIEEKLRRRNVDPSQTLIIVNPNASDMLPHRRWPLDNYAEVCDRLWRSHPELAFVVTGIKEESSSAKYLKTVLKAPVYDMTNDTSMGELLALYTRCRLMITNDSGPAHFAAIVGLPTVVLYGPETPLLFSPLGNRCTQLFANIACSPCVSPYNNKDTSCQGCALCMSAISPDQVVQSVERTLAAPRD